MNVLMFLNDIMYKVCSHNSNVSHSQILAEFLGGGVKKQNASAQSRYLL